MKYFNYIILFFIVLGLFDILRNRPLKTYHIYGEHNKDTIVFIHGLNDDDTSWYKQIPFFSKYYKCIVVNRTSLPKYLDYQDIYHIIKNNKSNGQLYCICASYGCEAAFKIQSNYNCFDKMVFMNYTWNPRYSYDYDCKYGIVYKFVYSGWFITNIINYDTNTDFNWRQLTHKQPFYDSQNHPNENKIVQLDDIISINDQYQNDSS